MTSIIQISGTITIVYPIEKDNVGSLVQKIMLNNVSSISHTVQVDPQIIVVVKVSDISSPIPFRINDPITVKGIFDRQTSDFLSIVYNTHYPIGYVRYNGKIYK